MQELAKLLGKSITRYILPGMVFYLLIVFFPIELLFSDIDLKVTETGSILSLMLVVGYLLDAIGAYRYTLCFKSYNEEKINLTNELKSLSNLKFNSDDPDKFIAQIWYEKNESYNRIIEERSEWVMILISSSILLLAVPEYVIFCFFSNKISCFELIPICFLSFMLSYLSAKTGIKRMKAHNQKMIYCFTELNKTRQLIKMKEHLNFSNERNYIIY